jgi:predicted permease
MGALLQDARYAFRWLFRNPGFAAVAVLTLGLGIGTVTTIFSVLDAAVLRPLSYRDPDALMTVAITHREGNAAPETFPWSSPKFESLRRHARSFESIAGHARLDLNLTGVAEPERLVAEIVSASYFPTLGVGASLGRTFAAEEDGVPGAHAVAVISDGLWRRRFGGDRSIVGRTIQINRKPTTVVGVASPGFAGLAGDVEIWVPMAMAGAFVYPEILTEGGNHWHEVVARRRAGVGAAEAAAEMAVVGERVDRENPMEVGGAIWGVSASPLNDSRVDPALRRSVLVLFGAVTFVLLIACANVAALMLARASTRGREVAIRVAIGAGRRRIVRQLLTESVVLALAGGLAGVLLSLWGVETLSRLERISGVGDPSFLFRFHAVALDGRVLLFALGVSVATGLLFGMAPALHATRSDLAAALKEGGAGALTGDGGSRISIRGLLVPLQVALALVLLVGAGLMTRSLARLTGFQGGFDSRGVLTLRFDPSGVADDDREKAIVFRRALLERLAALPGVESAAIRSTRNAWRPKGGFRPARPRSRSACTTSARITSGRSRSQSRRAAHSRPKTASARPRSPSSTRPRRAGSGPDRTRSAARSPPRRSSSPRMRRPRSWASRATCSTGARETRRRSTSTIRRSRGVCPGGLSSCARRATPRRSHPPSAGNSKRSPRTSLSSTSRRSTGRSRGPSGGSASARRCSPSSPASRSSSPPSASTDWWPRRSPRGPARSASAWRSAPLRATSSGEFCGAA